ncbi:MAG: hypothetical protein HC905_13220 [Bacteroidales bacterium]|nr:hypothetical protein [Bacteroidales bacterium]
MVVRENNSNGKSNNAASSSLLIYNFTSSLGQGKISGDFSYKNFDAPSVGIKLNSMIDLGSIRKFLAIDTIENLEGKLRTDIDFQAGFSNSDVFNRKNLRSLSINGNAKIVDAQLKLKGSNYLYRDINSEILLGNNIQFESLSLKIDENDFLSGEA